MRQIEASEVASLLKPGMRAYVGGSSNEPKALVQAISAQPDCARGVRFLQFPLPGLNSTDFSALHPEARMTTFFLTPQLQSSHAAGHVDFLPMHMRHIFDFLRATPLDLAFVQVARDRSGRLRSGPNVDFFEAAVASARCVVAELNDAIIAPLGAPELAPERVDFMLASHLPQVCLAPARLDDTARTIGARVAELIADGDCLQTGIGAIPAAILAALGGRCDLGWHGGLIDDAGMALIEGGAITGARKSRLRGRHVAGMIVGSQQLHDWAAEAPELLLAGADVTHDASVISGIDRFVSINSAVEVDLKGQVNAEVVNGRQVSGTGGAVDFMRAARQSRNGRSIVALTATARGGAVSRIVRQVAQVTAPRADVDLVVTEYGVARMHGATERERRQALIDIAHPAFRAELA